MEMFNQRDNVGIVPLNNVVQYLGYTDLLKSISPAMTLLINTKKPGKQIIKVFKQTV